MLEYHYADRLQYAVAGTPNRLEFDQGFFVKNGDGAADLYTAIDSKRKATAYLHSKPVLVEDVTEIARPAVSTAA